MGVPLESKDKVGRHETKKKNVLEAISEGRKMEAYAEHRTKDMRVCWLCESVIYRRKAGKHIGKKWICIDCLGSLNETLENLKQWEEELALETEMKKQLEDGLSIDLIPEETRKSSIRKQLGDG